MPAAIDLAGLLAAFLAFLVCYSLLVAYKSTLGALLQTLANAVHSVSVAGIHPLAFLSDGINALDSAINAALSAAVLGTEYAWHRMLHWTATLIHEAVTATADLADATYSAFRHTIEHVIPSLIGSAIRPLYGAVHSLSHQLAYLWRVVTSLAHKVDQALVIPAEKIVIQLPKTARHEATKAVKVATGAYADMLPRIRGLERDLHGIDETLKDTLRKVTPAGIAGLLIGSVLAKLGMTWLRCSNVNRVGRSVCGLNANVLEGLLAGLLSIFGTIGIVTFAKDVQKVVGDFGGEIGHFWRADVIGGGGDRALGSPGLQ